MTELSDRLQQILRAAAMTGINPTDQPEHPTGGWGEMDEDYSQAQHDRANGRAVNRDEAGMGYNTREEIDIFYDSVQRNTIELNNPEDKNE